MPRGPALSGARRLLSCLAIAAGIALAALAGRASADGVPGRFDFYVLALSWSPGYCATAERPDPRQCARHGLGFVVHGLWPQFEHGYPQSCASGGRLDVGTLTAVAGLMPSPGLARHEWRKHGTCSGLDARAYFALMRKAVAAVSIPAPFATPAKAVRMSPAAIERAFAAANPGLRDSGMAVICRRGRFSEIRICLDKDLGFRACREVDRDACRAGTISIPPSR